MSEYYSNNQGFGSNEGFIRTVKASHTFFLYLWIERDKNPLSVTVKTAI